MLTVFKKKKKKKLRQNLLSEMWMEDLSDLFVLLKPLYVVTHPDHMVAAYHKKVWLFML